jgi:hypothetical protein
VSLHRRLSCSLSAPLASVSVRLVFALLAASSPAWPYLCWARPSAYFSSSPVTGRTASFILPLALASIALLLPGHLRVRGIVFRSPWVGGARHVLDDNAALRTGAFDLGEVHA